MLCSLSVIAISALCAAPEDLQTNLNWAESAFSDHAAAVQPGHIAVLYEDSLGETKLNKSPVGGPIRLGEKTYEQGIGVNAHAVVRICLPRPALRFRADIGLDRNVDNSAASVRFRIETDGQTLFSTDVIRPGSPPIPIDLPLENVQVLDLIVDNGGDSRAFDQADWADARVVLDDGSEVFVNTLEQEGDGRVMWPFSFMYGGRPSSMLLPSWERRIETAAVDRGQRRSLVFTDPVTKLQVRAETIAYTDSPGVDWTLYFSNTGQTDTPVLEQVRALDTAFSCSPGSPATFHSLRSTCGADDWLPFEEPLPPGRQRAFAPHAGRSSLGACPFFHVQWDKGGAMAGIGWTGQWNAAVENRDGTVTLQAGMQNLHLSLHPGESIRTPRILFMQWAVNDDVQACNLWRATMLQHIVPRANGQIVVPPIAHLSTAFYEMDQCTESTALDHLNAGKDLGFECYWYDAYYGKDNFPSVGNYVLPVERGFNTSRFPRLLQPIADAVHQAGMDFLLWFEPERICPGTLMATEHPEWVVLPDDGGWGMFNLAVPEARQYITDYINSLITAYGLRWVRIDNAVSYTPLWQKIDAAAGPDRVGMAEIRYVEGLYRWWDDMRTAHPEIAIDNCASGGGRIDLELCARAIPLWRTDAVITPLLNGNNLQAALQNQIMNAGLSRYVPFSAAGQMGADPYNFRSGFNGGISFCEDTRPETYPRAMLRAAIEEGKRIRKYYFGNLYALTEVTASPKDWQVRQYHRTTENDGMVVAFRRPESPYTGFACTLHEIESTANYEVTISPGYSPLPKKTMKGAELRTIVLNVEAAPGSVLMEYRNLDK